MLMQMRASQGDLLLLALLAASLLLSVFLPTRYQRQLKRYRENRCVKRGYDLRATPDRCPKCGTIPPIIPDEKPKQNS
jgi:hypothetical protein